MPAVLPARRQHHRRHRARRACRYAPRASGSSSDEVSGEGLATPWISLPTPRTALSTNGDSTTSTSFSTVAISDIHLQHPKIQWKATAYCPAGTTGDVRLEVINGVVGQTWPITATGYTNVEDTLKMPSGFYGTVVQVAVDARVTSGPGGRSTPRRSASTAARADEHNSPSRRPMGQSSCPQSRLAPVISDAA